MRTKKVNRYYCDFCKKAGCGKGAMVKHEKHCTLNPNRECRMCKAVKHDQPTLISMMEILPNPEQYKKTEQLGILNLDSVSYPGFDEAFKSALLELRRRAVDCPACMLSAIRQSKIPVYMADGFDYKKEVEELWKSVNQQEQEREQHAYY